MARYRAKIRAVYINEYEVEADNLRQATRKIIARAAIDYPNADDIERGYFVDPNNNPPRVIPEKL